MKHPPELKRQLKLYDHICKLERKRLIMGYAKYKDTYKTKDLVKECKEELLDAFGYLVMMKMRR